MNLVLLEAADFETADRVRLEGRRARHVREVLRVAVGDRLVVGRLDGPVGDARVAAIEGEAVVLEVVLDRAPPAPIGITLVLALPRPPVLRRVLSAATAMGIKRILLIGARAVEKSFWQSHALRPEALRERLLLGLEQARDTALPRVETHRRFRPFVEDVLPGLLEGAAGYVAHPAADASRGASGPGGPAVLAIGPEGGWSDHEVERLVAAGCRPLALGERPLRVETAVPALVARLL